jgi:hypothetical protein
MAEFFRKYILNYKTLLFLAAFSATFLLLRYQQHQKAPILSDSVKTTQQTINLSQQLEQIKLLRDTSLNFMSLVKKTVAPVVIVLFDGSCSLCFIALSNWKATIEKEGLDAEKFMFIGYNASAIELEYISGRILTAKYNLFRDSAFVFGTTNGFSRGKPKSLLVGKEWKILAAGEPFENETLLHTFINEMKK